jgi:hypothetical protein
MTGFFVVTAIGKPLTKQRPLVVGRRRDLQLRAGCV